MADTTFPEQPPIPGYEPIRALGINDATVFLARQTSSGTLVALKVWPLEFEKQARDLHGPLARLHHPNIVRVFEMGQFEGRFFCALEYVESSLADSLREGPLSEVEAARLALTLCVALKYARKHGMVPVSLDAKSILLTKERVPKLASFTPGERLEKPENLPFPASLPPEWLLSGFGRTSEASQVYRVGVLLYEMLTARPPFAADDLEETVKLVLRGKPEQPRRINPDVSHGLDAICMKCLEREPKARYASLRALMKQLESFV